MGGKLIVDPIHGDIRLTPLEARVIDTAPFQRLRHLKQLAFGHVAYPGATHTRFAHSVGVLGIVDRITRLCRDRLALNDEQVGDVRLAGLLHDVGHYPYSHLMEKVDRVRLTEEVLGEAAAPPPGRYPWHEELGALILRRQPELVAALGAERAGRVADLITGAPATDPALGRLIRGSLDMDRLDYLLRDSMAAGVPFGQIDLNYLLNNFRASPSGRIGVPEKAISAVDHFLLGRFFMYRSVYYHKTTFGMEEACRQLLRRARDAGRFGMPADGDAVRAWAGGPRLGRFTDAFVDDVIEQASEDPEPVVSALGNALRRRRPPKLLREALVLERGGTAENDGTRLLRECRRRLPALADAERLPPGRFLIAQTPELTVERRGGGDEIIQVFVDSDAEPTSVVNVRHSIVHLCADHFFQATRLYLVPADDTDDGLVGRLRAAVKGW